MRPLTLALLFVTLCVFSGCSYKQPVSEVQNHLKGFVQKIQGEIDNKDSAGCKKSCDDVLAKPNLAAHDRASFEQLSQECQSGNWEAAKHTTSRMMGATK